MGYFGDARVSNTPGNPGNLLAICKVFWKFSGLVREFAHLSLTLVTILVSQSVSVQNISCGKPGSIDIEVSNSR